MKIDSLAVGSIGTNCYILQDEAAKLCAVIDPGDEPERIFSAVEQTGCTPTMILLTHGHFDHYTAVKGLLEKWPELPVYIHESDVTDKSVGSFSLLFPRLPEKMTSPTTRHTEPREWPGVSRTVMVRPPRVRRSPSL